MAIEIIIPKRGEEILTEKRTLTLRTAKFFEEIQTTFRNLPGVSTNVADVSVSSADPDIETLESKMNELLAALQAAGLMS